MVRHHRGEMITIRPVSRYNEFQVTSEHPVYAIKRKDVTARESRREGWLPEANTKMLLGAEPQWIPAGELEKGDFVLVPKLERSDSSNFSDAEVELLGYYLAEGSTYFNKANKQHTNQFSLGLHETELADRICDLVGEVTSRPIYRTPQADRNGMGLAFYSEQFSEWFAYHCGKGACTKELSAELMDLPPHQLKIFLDAYLEGDGNVCERKNSRMVRFCTGSETLARQVQMLLNKVGVHAWISGARRRRRQVLQPIGSRHQPSAALSGPATRRTPSGTWCARPKTTSSCRFAKSRARRGTIWSSTSTWDETHSYVTRGVAVHNCTAPKFDTNQLHAAVVELVAMDRADIKYSTVQNWYPGDKDGKGGIYNFVTKRGACRGESSKISWTQVETGSAITWKYPGVILQGDNSIGEFYSVAVTNNAQLADTGTKMIHIGKNTRSTIVSKGISAGRGQNSYRGLVKVLKGAENARNFSQCDSLLIGDRCGAHTFPYIEVRNPTAKIEHEASTSKVGEDQIFYCNQRGIATEDAVSMIVNGFCKEVFKELPMEFAVEAQKLLGISLEGSVG